MKAFSKCAAQGDVFFTKIDALPDGVVAVEPEGGKVIVAHSETLHNHVMSSAAVTMYRLPEEIYECFLVVAAPAVLEHQRPFDTHEPIQFAPGVYRVRRQREYVAEGFRRVED
jgi:hypothetical protein